jgi:hypothetical protein
VRNRPARSRRLVLAAALGAGAVVVGAGPALAGPPTINVSSPASGSVSSTASPQIGGTVSSTAPGGVVSGSLALAVSSSAGHPGWNASVPSWCGQSGCSFTVSVNPGLAYNGQYQLTVSAQETDPPLGTTRSSTWTGSFSLAVPPVSPRDGTATPASDGSSVTLSWAANPEPDIVGYQVDRNPASPGNWPQAVTATDLVDSAVSPGHSYTYTVTAVRQGASSGSVLYSSPTRAAATDPTVADAGPGTSGSGSTGAGSTGTGSGSTGSTGTASSGSGSASGTGTAGSGSSGSGSKTSAGSSSGSSGQPSLGTYGKAGSGSSSGGSQNLSSFDQLVKKTSAQQAAAGNSPSGVDGAALPPLGNGVAPGSDNPEVAPFSSGSSQTQAVAGGSTTISYTTRVENHQAVVRDFAAVGLAALLLAVVAHLLWLRRAVSAAP